MIGHMEERDELVGASLRTAARVIGVPRTRLIAWANRGLLEPQERRVGSAKQRVWTYGFEDLVLGRIIRILEDDHQVYIGQIASIIQAVRDWPGDDPLTSFEWAASSGEAFVRYQDGSWHGSRQPPQGVMREALDLDKVRIRTRQRLDRPSDKHGLVESRRGVHGRKEVFAGTRVPVETVVRYLQHGFAEADVLESFPDLVAADVAVALDRLAV